jgi:hypothetical protein
MVVGGTFKHCLYPVVSTLTFQLLKIGKDLRFVKGEKVKI